MAAKKSSTKRKGTAAASKGSSGGKKTASKKRSAAQARAEREREKKRFITAIVLFLLAVWFIFIYLIPGEKLWLSLHELYRGLFGFFGFAVPLIMIYCSYQNGKDEPTPGFAKKTVLFSGLTVAISSAVYSFAANGIELGSYIDEIHQSFIRASSGNGTGFIGAAAGIPLAKLFGSVGGGFVSLLIFIVLLAFAADTLMLALLSAAKQPVIHAGEHISDEREIRTEVRRRRQEAANEDRRQRRKQYVEEQIEKRSAPRKKKDGNPDYSKMRKSAFYSPGMTSDPAVPASPVDTEVTQPKQKKKRPAKEKAVQTAEPVTPEIQEDEPVGFEGVDFDLSALEFTPAEEPAAVEDTHDDMVDIGAIYTPQPSRKNKKDPLPVMKIDTSSSIVTGSYIRPPFNLLEPQPPESEANISMELNQSGRMLVETLKSFGVQTSIVNISRGPSVTRYELQPAAGVKISKITNLSDDIAMNLAATGVRIEAPIPGKSAVGIEVPNKNVSIVKMRNLLESKEFQSAKSNLTVALGKDITGRITLADLSRMPHLLIAGSTGSGKSVCINSMLVSLLYKASPDDVKLMLIDPKVVELGVYNGIPHLLVPVVTDPRKAAGALSWAVNEMLNRYKTFAEYNVRDMHSYNRLVDRQNAEAEMYQNEDIHSDDAERSFEEDEMLAQAQAELNRSGGDDSPPEPKKLTKMPQIVIVIDELADLMMAAPNEVEESICRLAQMARAAGMHLVIATQRPSVDVITGLIKANVPSRIAFAVKSQIDSRTILDTGGADKLLGRGDMLFSPIGTTKPIRVQGCFVDDTEIENIIDFIKKNKAVEYDSDVLEEIERNAKADAGSKSSGDEPDGDMDPMMEEAIRCVVEAGQASTSMLQRRFRVGYARAGRLIDEMEQMGIVGPHEGSKPRQVLMTYQQWLERSTTQAAE